MPFEPVDEPDKTHESENESGIETADHAAPRPGPKSDRLRLLRPMMAHRMLIGAGAALCITVTALSFWAGRARVAPSSAVVRSRAAAAPVAAPTAVAASPLAGYVPTSDLLMQGPEGDMRVALTFDAGSDAKAVPLILKELQARHVHATFFLTGRFCEKFPEECRAIADAGMELGNHSYRHPHFTRLSATQIRQELDRAEAAIVKACGRGAKPLFRFPYGDCDERTQEIVAAAGYQPIRWTLDSLDSVGKKKSADFVAQRINSRIKPGYITLMHVSCVTSAEALPRIFEQLDSLGARVTPVSELLLAKPNATKASHDSKRADEKSGGSAG